MQYNAITKADYQGHNQAELMEIVKSKGYQSEQWATFLQWRQLGRKIRKGEHGVSVFKGFATVDDNQDGKLSHHSAPLGFATVFNESQTDLIN